MDKRKKKPKISFGSWFLTFTKRAVTVILITALFDLQMSYLLAFIGREQIAESLSSTIAEMVIGVMSGYFVKSLLETFFENREKRLNKNKNKEGEMNDADLLSDSGTSCSVGFDESDSGRDQENPESDEDEIFF